MAEQGTAGDERLPPAELAAFERRCGRCAMGQPYVHLDLVECREGPQALTVVSNHWCYRFRPMEAALGGVDVRKTSSPSPSPGSDLP